MDINLNKENNEDDIDDKLVNMILDYDEFLTKFEEMQFKISTHLRLSINKLLEYGDKHHYNIANRDFLESVVKEDGKYWLESDEMINSINKMRKNIVETTEHYNNHKNS